MSWGGIPHADLGLVDYSPEALMRIFHRQVFDAYVTGSAGTTYYVSEGGFNDLLGSVDSLSVGGYVSQVTGATPTLKIEIIEHAADDDFFRIRSTQYLHSRLRIQQERRYFTALIRIAMAVCSLHVRASGSYSRAAMRECVFG
jgi:hypothetical protein